MPCSRTWVVSHCVGKPSVHMKHSPHAIWNGTTTWSPGEIRDRRANLFHDAHRLVSEDVSFRHEGRKDLVEVQVGAERPLVVTRMIASLGSLRIGSGTVSAPRRACRATPLLAWGASSLRGKGTLFDPPVDHMPDGPRAMRGTRP